MRTLGRYLGYIFFLLEWWPCFSEVTVYSICSALVYIVACAAN